MHGDLERLLQLAESYVEVGRAPEALNILADAVKASPEDPRVLTTLSAALLEAGQFTRAAHTASQAIAADPEAERAWRIRAVALARAARSRPAQESAAHAARLEPHNWLTHLTVASVAVILKKVTVSTLDSSRRAVELEPGNPDAHATHGQVLFALNRPAEADDAFRRALALDPQHREAQLSLTATQLRQQNVTTASQSLVGYLREDPQSVIARFNLVVPFMALLLQITVVLSLLGVMLSVLAVTGSHPAPLVGLAVGGSVGLYIAVKNYRAAKPHATGVGGFLRIMPRWPRRGAVACIIGLVLIPVTLLAVFIAPVHPALRPFAVLLAVLVAVGGFLLMRFAWRLDR